MKCRGQPYGQEVENAFLKLYREGELAYTLNVKFPPKPSAASAAARSPESRDYFLWRLGSSAVPRGGFQESMVDKCVLTV